MTTQAATPEQLEAIDQKLDKGEELTAEEKALVEVESPATEEEVDPENKTVGVPKKEEKKDDDEDDSEEEGEEEKPESNEKTAETPAEKDAKTAEAKKKEAEDAAAKEAERKALIEKEAEKPLDEANIENYSPTERALFFELRKERRKRQEAQRESDTLKFQRQKEERQRQAEAERKAAEEAEIDPFEGKEDDDLLTVADVKKLFPKGKKEAQAGKGEPDKSTVEQLKSERLQKENWFLKAQQKAPDLLTVLPYADQLLMDDDDAREEVEDVVAKGGNPILATYKILKAHPKWPEIEAKLKGTTQKADDKGEKKKEDANLSESEKKDRAARIEKNEKKTVTTGTGGGGSATPGEYTIQEILDMSEEEFGNLPKAQREKILRDL